MTDPTESPPRSPGWYRVTGRDWQPLTDAEALDAIDAGAIDLVHVDDIENVPLW